MIGSVSSAVAGVWGILPQEAISLILSVGLSFIVSIAAGPLIIKWLRKLKFGQEVRDDGPESHLKKQGTPTIGALIFLLGTIVSVLVFAWPISGFTAALLVATFGFGLIGFLDDILKIVKKRSLGLKAWQKIAGQLIVSAALAVYCYTSPLVGSAIYIPFFNVQWDMGWFYIPFAIFVFLAMSNGSNLTDGLDGLLGGTSVIIMAAFGVIFYALTSVYAGISAEAAANMQGMLIFSGALTGGILAFLRFNSNPAKVFMGDTGSMAIGGAIAMMGLLSKLVLLLPIMAGVFVASSVSVILQVASFKLRKKRIFRMAPLHHHFELGGSPEVKIVAVYMIVTVVLCLAALLIVG